LGDCSWIWREVGSHAATAEARERDVTFASTPSHNSGTAG